MSILTRFVLAGFGFCVLVVVGFITYSYMVRSHAEDVFISRLEDAFSRGIERAPISDLTDFDWEFVCSLEGMSLHPMEILKPMNINDLEKYKNTFENINGKSDMNFLLFINKSDITGVINVDRSAALHNSVVFLTRTKNKQFHFRSSNRCMNKKDAFIGRKRNADLFEFFGKGETQ